jgi:hypothetical protein
VAAGAAKALFIEQMRRNEVLDTEVEDLSGGDIGAAAAETKAIATGDPRYLRQVQLEDDVKRLTALERAHRDTIRRRDYIVTTHQRAIPTRRRDLDTLAPIAQRAAQTGANPAIRVAGHTYPERAAAAEAFAGACRHAFLTGKDRGATQFIPLGATIDGVEVLAARDLTNDMLVLRLAVPSRIAELSRADLMATSPATDTAAGAKARGLLKRAENLYSGLPHHHQTLSGELHRDQTELDDLLANPPAPFDPAAELTDKQAALAALTLQLQLAAESPEAQAQAAAAHQRMAERGRKPGWSLLLNPTPRILEELGYPTAAALRRAIAARERLARQHAHGQSRDLDTPEPEI